MILLLIPIVVTAVFLFMKYFVGWLTHRDMVKEHCKIYGKGSFSDFMREFVKVEWHRKDEQPVSYFSDNYDSDYVHASIIKFNGIGMTLSFWGWIKFDMFVNNNKLKTKVGNYNWKENN